MDLYRAEFDLNHLPTNVVSYSHTIFFNIFIIKNRTCYNFVSIYNTPKELIIYGRKKN